MVGSPTSNPRITIQLLQSGVVDAFEERRDIIYGQLGVGATATALALNEDIHLLSDTELQALFGTGEMYWRIRKWIDAVEISDGGFLPALDAVAAPIPTASSPTAAEVDVVFATTASGDGEYTISIVDEEEFTLTLTVLDGALTTAAATALNDAINALDAAPFASTLVSSTVTIKATDVSTVGNDFGIKITDNTLVGMTATIEDGGFAIGTQVSPLTGIFDSIAGTRYTGVGWPESWDRDTIIDELEERFNVSNDILDGIAFQGLAATFADIGLVTDVLNSQVLVLIGNNVVVDNGFYDGPAIFTPADWIASQFMAIRDKRLTTGAAISDLIIATNGGFDATGGPSLASLPYFNTEIPDAPLTSAETLFTSTEQLSLETDGFSSIGVNRAKTAMIMAPLVTTLTTDSSGSVNDSFHYLNFVDTGSVSREIFFNTLKAVYGQTRLTEGNVVPGRSMANAQSIKAQLLLIYRELANLALTQAGSDAEAFFSANTTVVVDLAGRSVTIEGPLPIVTQLGSIDYNLTLAFSIDNTGFLITF